MHTRTATTAVLLAAGLTLTGCTSSSSHDKSAAPTTVTRPVATTPPVAPVTGAPIPDSPLAKGSRTAACWRAIRDQYAPGTAQLTGAPTTPPECAGLSTDELADVVSDVLEHQFGG